MKKHILPIVLLFIAVNSFAQTIPSPAENYVYTKTYLSKPGDPIQKLPLETIQYFDGLGRAKQVLNVKASPLGNDVVTKIEYDNFGRQTKDYLPVPQQGSSNGAIYGDPLANVSSTPYGTEKIYSEKTFDNSPLDKVIAMTQPGNDWQSKPVLYDYKTNGANELKRLTAGSGFTNGATSSYLYDNNYYSEGKLYKNIITDEDGNMSIEYKNGQGQTIMVRKVLNSNENADTYYVYDSYNYLVFIVPPNCYSGGNHPMNSSTQNELMYQYRYDGQGRLVEKKIPGKGWEYLVYDNQDRLVMTQDANMGAGKQWLFTKYDQFGRVAYTGIYTSEQDYGSAGRAYEQGQVNGKGSNNVERTTSNFVQPGLLVYYDNNANKNYPNTITKLLSVNYYDTYPTDKPNLSTLNFTQTFISDTPTNNISTKSLPTASYINNVEANGWTKNYSYYDGKGRAIATYSKNHLGGYTKIESFLDFTGVPQQVITRHKRRNADAELVVKEEFGYDDQNRLLTHTHEVVGKTTKELLVENHYNEIGQLDWKKVGGVSGSPLQKVDLSYNIRGWMTGINSGDILYSPSDESYILDNGKLFGYNIRYNNPENPSLGAARYNGNIAEIDWISRDVSLKRYGYQYDQLNRLLRGNYQDPGSALPETHINDEALTYDLNGNIKTLVRNAKNGKFYTPIVVDNLGYQYTGNRVTNITDASGNSSGYEGGGQTMTYDANGNTTAMPDKKISAIDYNFLNLPQQINQDANTLRYYYRADGVKVKKKFTLINSLGTKIINTEYLDGFQYSTPNTDPIRRALEKEDDATTKVATAGEEEAFSRDTERKVVAEAAVDPGTPEVENMILSFFPTSEGYYDYENFRYIYQYKDHLGNVRVSYVKNGDDLEIKDRNDYYPFGMSFIKGNQLTFYDPMTIPYNYKFQEQELQETGFYSFKWRQYMPDVGRFFNIDPLSEKYAYQSHYNFSENRVVDARELEGLEAEIINKSTVNTSVSSDISGFPASTPAKIQLTANVVQGSFTNEQVGQKLSTIESNFKKDGIDLTIVQDNNATYTIDMTYPGESVTKVNDDGTTRTGTILGDAPLGDPITATVRAKDGNTDTITHEIGHTFGAPHIWDVNSGVDNTPANKNNRMNSYENPTSSMRGFGTEFNKNQIQKMEQTVKGNSFRLPKNKN